MQALSIQVKQELEELKNAGASSTDQMSSQQEALQQVQKLTDSANRHDDQIGDLRGMSDTTCDERESRENGFKMIIKNQVLAQRSNILGQSSYHRLAAAESTSSTTHKARARLLRSSMAIHALTSHSGEIEDTNTQQTFERFAYTSFSGKRPLHYWDSEGNRLSTGKEDGTR